MGLSALAGAHCLRANTHSPPVWQQCRPRSIPCTAPPPAYWPLPIHTHTHTHPLSMLSRQQRQSLTLHCIANGCRTISQERKEFCSAVRHEMVTWFNTVASDPWAKCDNWHYYYFWMYHSDPKAVSDCVFYIADRDQSSVTWRVCKGLHNYRYTYNFYCIYFNVCSQDLRLFYQHIDRLAYI